MTAEDGRRWELGEERVTLPVRVQPRASRSEVVGWKDDALYVRLTAPPVEGAANAALVEFIAERLELKSRQVSLVSGEKSRDKLLVIEGVSRDELDARLGVKRE